MGFFVPSPSFPWHPSGPHHYRVVLSGFKGECRPGPLPHGYSPPKSSTPVKRSSRSRLEGSRLWGPSDLVVTGRSLSLDPGCDIVGDVEVTNGFSCPLTPLKIDLVSSLFLVGKTRHPPEGIDKFSKSSFSTFSLFFFFNGSDSLLS